MANASLNAGTSCGNGAAFAAAAGEWTSDFTAAK